METLVPQVLPYIGPSALPLLIVVLFYIKIKNERAKTKVERDNDSQNMHDDVLKLKFEVSELKGIVNLHRDKLDSIDKQLNIVNQELVKLNMTVEHLADALERQNQIMLRSLEKNDDRK
jgi:peptidoglycan hydrolase CwlO-like protein